MKEAKVLLLLMIGVVFSITASSNTTSDLSTTTYYSEADVATRILNSSAVLAEHYEPTVHDFVKDNLYQGKRGFAKTLSRTQMYFPVIEQYLEFYGLPDDLKHMVIVESQAKPHAQSSVGAVGLWQLMPETATRYGLTVNDVQDDRKDPRKATEAALKYLSYLHEFLGGDWALAISAYNCGEGRVKRAIREANSTDYEVVKDYLPKQTQKYVPAIIAAGYSVNYHHLHNVQTADLDYAVKFTNAIQVFDKLSFTEISNITNTPIAIIQRLNPSYTKGYIPTSKRGNYVVLPASAISTLSQFLNYSDRYVVETRF